MKTLILLLLLFHLSLVTIYSQDITSQKYMPLKIGNVWVYDHYKLQYNFHERVKYKVIGDTIARGHKYYKSSAPLPFMHVDPNYLNLLLYRVDSADGCLLAFKNESGCIRLSDILIDSLASGLNNTFVYCPFALTRKCIDTAYFTMFNTSFKNKWYLNITGPYQTPTRYLYNIGLLGSANGSIGQEGYNLLGCVINGVVYGDTSMLVGIESISNNIPEEFSLSQNYPNPFNPSTKIRFSIPPYYSPLEGGMHVLSRAEGGGDLVTLKIYNVLGREAAVLVNDELKPGTYEVEWDAANFSSGIYYYKLTAGQYFSQTKKMVLVR